MLDQIDVKIALVVDDPSIVLSLVGNAWDGNTLKGDSVSELNVVGLVSKVQLEDRVDVVLVVVSSQTESDIRRLVAALPPDLVDNFGWSKEHPRSSLLSTLLSPWHLCGEFIGSISILVVHIQSDGVELLGQDIFDRNSEEVLIRRANGSIEAKVPACLSSW